MAELAPTALADPEADVGARLYEEHAEDLLRYCRRQLGSQTEAEDAVQTTFVCALRALRRGTVPENEAAWLTTIARNVCHWQRRTLTRRGWQSGEVDLDTFASTSPEPGSYDDLRGLDEALASIPEQQRRAIVLREWLGVSPAEIAGTLGLTPTATHALLTRARVSLAGALTAARQPVVGLGWLVCELRSQLRNLLGAVTTKAGVAAVWVVASTGVGGLVVQQATGSNEGQPAAEAPAVRAERVAPTAGSTGREARVSATAVRTLEPSASPAPHPLRAEPAPTRITPTSTRKSTATAAELPSASTAPPAGQPETIDRPSVVSLPEAPRVPALPTPELPTVPSTKRVRDVLEVSTVESIVKLVSDTAQVPPVAPPTGVTPDVPDVASTLGSGGVTPPPVPPPSGLVP